MHPFSAAAERTGSRAQLERIVHNIGHLLPAQGPISVFIHHNPLHAFEYLPFEKAVEQGAQTFGCEPFLSEERYRDELRRGRIHESDVDAVLVADMGPRAEPTVIGELSRYDMRRRILLYGLPELRGAMLDWTLVETRALREFRNDLPSDARESFVAGSNEGVRRRAEARQVCALWSACQRAVQRATTPPPPTRQLSIRHRDLLYATADTDVDEWVHPVLIRVASAYLDQGLADWVMPARERGLFACFVNLYHRGVARLCHPFGTELCSLLGEEVDTARDSWASLEASLFSLGVPAAEWEPFLLAEALALRGFAGMMYQFELRPDRVPVFSLPARLVDFLATRLLLVRAALTHAARQVGFSGALRDLRSWLGDRLPSPAAANINERAWPLFQVAQLAGLFAHGIDELNSTTVDSIEREIRDFDSITRRRLLHQAYERRLRHRFFDAIVKHSPAADFQPGYQAIFCIDEREESMRRHLEEVDPDAETFGVAGFFGVAMYYRGAMDAHARPLCPVAIQPRHFVAEIESAEPQGIAERMLRSWNRVGALLDKNVHMGARHARRGAFLFATVGVLWVLPLVFRVVFPWFTRWVARSYGQLYPFHGRLAVEHGATALAPPVGEQSGFTTAEMAEIVFSQLAHIGIRERFAPLVLVFGHGSTSLNNPHESAHDCGACGGGRGGPNARAFAQMANNPVVRDLVAKRGLQIPDKTWFVGGERNTASNDIHLFDVDLVPEQARPVLRRARANLEEARRREAHERCRRFDRASTWLPPTGALLHVQARATDLAQPRPEYGHATNAVCFIGRRLRTRGLFLDRRAFLISYDPNGDADGESLQKLLSAVVPVVAGISLEYLFGYVDPAGYGSGTKLPHNVTALVGVMDGAQSDLRTGLPWQMLEIHEPVRLSIVVEADVVLLRGLLEHDLYLKQLVDHRWIFLAALDPESDALVELESTTSQPYKAERMLRVGQSGSRRYYEGHRDHLPFAAMDTKRGWVP